MNEHQEQELNSVKKVDIQNMEMWFDYWKNYSSFGHWQFWFVLALLLLPLIILFIFIYKKKALLLGFYGYNIHVFFTYFDAFGANRLYWYYPYKVLPILPSNLSLDASFVPICYMFIYQLVLLKQKNYYVLMVALSAVLAFAAKPFLFFLGFFQLDRGANYFHLFCIYVAVGLIAKWITNLFLFIQNKGNEAHA